MYKPILQVELESDSLGLEVLIERLLAEVLAEAGPLEAAERCRHVCLVVAEIKHVILFIKAKVMTYFD